MSTENIDDVQEYLRTATHVLRKILSTDKEFAQRITRQQRKRGYTLAEGEQKVNSLLVSFYGAYDGCGIVLLTDPDGRPAFGISIYLRRSSLEPTLWKSEKRLPTEFIKVLSTLRTQKRVREIFKGL